MLNQPAPELAAAVGDRGALLGAAHGKPRQVLPEGLELALGTGPIDGLQALVELLLGQPSGSVVLADLAGRPVAVVI